VATVKEIIYTAFREIGSRVMKFRPERGVPTASSPAHLEAIHTLYRDATTRVLGTRGPSFEKTGSKDAFDRDIVKTAIGTLFREKGSRVLKSRVLHPAPECVCTVCTEPDVFVEDYFDDVKVTPVENETCAEDGVVDHTGIGEGIVHRCMTVALAGSPTPCACMDRTYGPLQRTPCRRTRLPNQFGAFGLPGLFDGNCQGLAPEPLECGEGTDPTDVQNLQCEACTHCSSPGSPGTSICGFSCRWTHDTVTGECHDYMAAVGSNGLHCWSGTEFFPGCPGMKFVGCEQTIEAAVGTTPAGAEKTRRERERDHGCIDEIVGQAIDSCVGSTDETRQKAFIWSFEKGAGVSACNGCTECAWGAADFDKQALGQTDAVISCAETPPLCENLESGADHSLQIFIVTHCQQSAAEADSDSCDSGHIWAHVKFEVTYLDYVGPGGTVPESPHNCGGSGVGPDESIVSCPDTCSSLDLTPLATWDTVGGVCKDVGVGANDFTDQVNRFSTDCFGKAIPLINSIIPRNEICAPGKSVSQGGRVLSLVTQEPYHWSGGVYPPGSSDTYLGPILTLTLFSPDDDDQCKITVADEEVTISCPGYSATPTP